MEEFRKTILHESDIEEGINTKFWKAVVEWIDESLDTIHKTAEDPDGETDFGTFKRLGGNAQSLRRIKMLPDIFKSELKLLTDEEE